MCCSNCVLIWADNMELTLVLSSGKPFLTLEAYFTNSIRDIKQRLRRTLISQVNDLPYGSPEDLKAHLPVFQLRPPFSLHEYDFRAYIKSYDLQLFQYQGDRLRDQQAIGKEPISICVLRPTDVVTTCCTVEGKEGVTVFNGEEEVEWGQSQSLASRDGAVIELVFISAQNEVFLCSAFAADTVQTLKHRLQQHTSYLPELVTLWFQGSPLDDNLSLQTCGLRNRSRLTLTLSGEKSALVKDRVGRVAVAPLCGAQSQDSVAKKVRLLVAEWGSCEGIYEATCTCSSLPTNQIYLVCLFGERLLSLQLEDGHTEKVVIPVACTVEEVKHCIEVQHGLSAASMSLTLIGELPLDKTARDLGVETGDNLLLIKKEVKTADVYITIYRRKVKRFIHFPSTNTIAQLIQKLQEVFPTSDSNLLVLNNTEILPNAATFAQCGLTGRVTLHCGTEREIALRLEKLSRYGFISLRNSRNLYAEPDHSLELFDIGQDPNRLSAAERLQRYEREMQQTIRVRLTTATYSVFSLNVHEKVTISLLKSHLEHRLHTKVLKIMHGDKELEDNKTLKEQEVRQGSDLSVVSPNTWRVTVTTVLGQRFCVMLLPFAPIDSLRCALEELTGLSINQQRLICAKELTDGQMFPAAVGTLQAFIKLGK